MLSLYKLTFLFLFGYRNLLFLLIFWIRDCIIYISLYSTTKGVQNSLVLHVSIHTGGSESIGCLVFVH